MFSRTLIFIAFFLLLSVEASFSGPFLDAEGVNMAIKEKGATWVAGETSVSQLTREQQKQRLNAHPEVVQDKSRLAKLVPAPDLPFRFSWRDNGGDYITPVRDQGMCGSCSYFSTLAAVEAWERIRSKNPRLNIDLSEQYILSCGAVGSCERGAMIQEIYRFMMQKGTVQEECFPYMANDAIPCSDVCPPAEQKFVRIGNFVVLDGFVTTVEDLKNAVYHRPVSASMAVYEDFYYYTNGVYEHVTGELDGYHAVLIYGWDEAEQSWLCKNSWGTSWGNRGHFRIKYDDSYIASVAVLLWDEPAGSPRLDVFPQIVDITLAPGESTTKFLTVKNAGSGN